MKLTVIPCSPTLVRSREIFLQLKENLGTAAPQLLGESPRLVTKNESAIWASPRRPLNLEMRYALLLAVENTLEIAVLPNARNINELDCLITYGRNLDDEAILVLAERWQQAGHHYEVNSQAEPGSQEDYLLIALAVSLAEIYGGQVIVPRDGMINLEMGVYTAAQFKQVCLRPGSETHYRPLPPRQLKLRWVSTKHLQGSKPKPAQPRKQTTSVQAFTFESYKTFIQAYDKLAASHPGYVRQGAQAIQSVQAQQVVEQTMPAAYRARLPTYLLARCPLCGGEVTEAIDTFSLAGPGWWLKPPLGWGWYGPVSKTGAATDEKTPSYQASCAHVRALTYGVNLNGIYPDDVRYRSMLVIGSERPGLFKPFMAQEDSYAVMHTLPVGRWDDAKWQPRYTAYFILYFKGEAQDSRPLAASSPWSQSPFHWRNGEIDYNLVTWLEARKLFWLGNEAEGYPLIQGSVDDFPYHTLDGLRGPWAIYGGDLHLFPDLAASQLGEADPKLKKKLARLRQVEQQALQARALVRLRHPKKAAPASKTERTRQSDPAARQLFLRLQRWLRNVINQSWGSRPHRLDEDQPTTEKVQASSAVKPPDLSAKAAKPVQKKERESKSDQASFRYTWTWQPHSGFKGGEDAEIERIRLINHRFKELDVPATPFTFRTYKAFVDEYDLLVSRYKHFTYRGKPPPEYYQFGGRIYYDLPPIYRAKLPRYVLARCPICDAEVSEAVDTFSLAGFGWWYNEPRGFGWLGRSPSPRSSWQRQPIPSYQTQCPHIRTLVYGVNLNGIYPDDARPRYTLEIGSECPGLLRPFMEQEGSYAVIHTLPVGRLDDAVWHPRYTAYFLTYFSEDAQTYPRSLAPQTPDDRDFCWPYDDLDYDLDTWLEAGKLFWLGDQADGSPLEQAPKTNFPYHKLDGLRGRWGILGDNLHLLPNDMTLMRLRHASARRKKAFQRLRPIERQALQARDLKRLGPRSKR